MLRKIKPDTSDNYQQILTVHKDRANILARFLVRSKRKVAMRMKKIVGYCLVGIVLVAAFIASFTTIAIQSSLLVACGIFALTGLMMGMIGIGVHLTTSN